jgi:hypothetical protein
MQAHEKQILKSQLATAKAILSTASSTPLNGFGPSGPVVVSPHPQMVQGIDQLIKVIEQVIEKS